MRQKIRYLFASQTKQLSRHVLDKARQNFHVMLVSPGEVRPRDRTDMSVRKMGETKAQSFDSV